MDTGTHIVMGIALGGLATLDPIVSESSVTAHSVMIGTIIGSQIPDIDTVLKLKNNAKYIRNHRGITHSIPAVILWPIILSSIIYSFSPEANLFHLWIWTFIAVILHVFVDIFNAYGTQALRPFTKEWLALGVINTFDPFIFFTHVIGLILWRYGGHPGYIFVVIYGIIFIYYLLRFYAKHKVIKTVKQKINDIEEINISPSFRFHYWHLAISTKDKFYVAKAFKDQVDIIDVFEKKTIPNSPLMQKALKDDNLSAFLSFSPIYRWKIVEYKNQYEVRFIDLRYRSKGYYPFVAVVHLDQHLNIISSYTGWIFSEEKLMKKLEIASN